MDGGGGGGGADTSKDKVNKFVATLEVKKDQSLRKMYNVKFLKELKNKKPLSFRSPPPVSHKGKVQH